MRIIMSVGYKPYVKTIFTVRAIVEKERCGALTEIPTMEVKPGSSINTLNVEIQYKILE